MKLASPIKTSSNFTVNAPLGGVDSNTMKFWGVWAAALTPVLIMFSLVLDIAPFMHIDEFMTIDLGRVILQPDTTWSIAWMLERNQAAFVFFYVGPVLQELAYQSIGEYGPRISGILGAVAAATAMVGWQHTRGTSGYASLVLGLIFLLDPIFVQAYTIGRVDGWAMAACLTACWCLESINKEDEIAAVRHKLILAGGATALAFFIWPSAIFLLPLVLFQLFTVIKRAKTIKPRRKVHQNNAVFLFIIGGSIASAALLIPIAPKLLDLLGNVIDGVIINSRTGTANYTLLDSQRITTGIKHLLQVLKFTPVLVTMALIGAFRGREWGLIAAGAVATLLMIATVVYSHRIQYLLPYFIVMTSGLIKRETGSNLTSKIKLSGVLALASLLVWSAGLSLIARSIIAFEGKRELNRGQIYATAQEMIGVGEYAVYSFPYEFYYAGRSLGWKMYKPYLAVGVDPLLHHEVLQRMLKKVDFAIMPLPRLTPELEEQIQKAGMYEKGVYQVYEASLSGSDNRVTNKTRLQTFFFIPRQPYGPYKLYEKIKLTKMAN
ncbi:hypothetical protein [Pontibacter mucosus]|nr:hypothetical protein [Pontibacter mucosus]